jgi:N,N'-diacetylchitobiose non-reducing end deacetylase
MSFEDGRIDTSHEWRDFGTVLNGVGDGRLRRVLVVIAHPIDLVEYCVGTVARLTSSNVLVSLVCMTSGERGTHAARGDHGKSIDVLESDFQLVAQRLGASKATFLRRTETLILDELGIRSELIAQIRRERPDVLLTFDPTPQLRQHLDHRATGRIALDAAWPCAGSLQFEPQLGDPHQTTEAWLFGGPTPDLFVTIGGDIRQIVREATHDQASFLAEEEQFAQVDLR